MWHKRTDMWCVAFIFIAVVSCNAEYSIKTTELAGVAPSRIIGGSATTIQQYPYTVQVLYYAQFFCGGSLLTPLHVLSAAHCFVDDRGIHVPANLYTIRAGTTTLNAGGSLHGVVSIRVHESYNNPIRDSDVAVVILNTPVNFLTTLARPASIPHQGNVVPDNSSVTAVGWGLTNVNNTFPSSVLNEVTVRKINRTVCQNRYLILQAAQNFPYPITSNMICAGILDVGGKDACQGDSGGPLIYNGVVVGITSWGAGCALPLYPGVSARVASYTNWISNVVSSSNGSTNTTNIGDNAGSLSVGAVTLLAPLMYLILSV